MYTVYYADYYIQYSLIFYIVISVFFFNLTNALM